MPLPLIPVVAALATGGTLVPHAAGGLIVTAATGGYVAGTYLSTAAIASIIVGATASVGVGAAAVTGAASALIGSAGIFGTTIGATGLTGVLMSAGILPSTPIAVPIAIGSAALGGGYLAYYLIRLRRKVTSATEGEEVHFSEKEAKVIEALVRLLAKRKPSE
jgi:uncharacterized membrane protein